MNDNPDETDSLESQSEPMSLSSRLANVYASPVEAFRDIREKEVRHANWVVPLVLGCMVGILYVVVMFTKTDYTQVVRDQQIAAMQQQVEEGEITQEAMDQGLAASERFMTPKIMAIFGSFAAVIGGVAFTFFLGFVLWLLSRLIFKPQLQFFKAMEIVGLSAMISVLGGIVSALLMAITGSPQMSLGPALFVSDFNPANKVHAILAALNVFAFWYVGILALGLAVVTRHSIKKTGLVLFFGWAVLKFGGILASP
jgi:hypothetical protein